MIVMDNNSLFLLSGTGDVVEPEEPVIAIGSGGLYAYASALSLMQFSNLGPLEIVNESLKMASKICIFTNNNFTIETLE